MLESAIPHPFSVFVRKSLFITCFHFKNKCKLCYRLTSVSQLCHQVWSFPLVPVEGKGHVLEWLVECSRNMWALWLALLRNLCGKNTERNTSCVLHPFEVAGLCSAGMASLISTLTKRTRKYACDVGFVHFKPWSGWQVFLFCWFFGVFFFPSSSSTKPFESREMPCPLLVGRWSGRVTAVFGYCCCSAALGWSEGWEVFRPPASSCALLSLQMGLAVAGFCPVTPCPWGRSPAADPSLCSQDALVSRAWAYALESS